MHIHSNWQFLGRLTLPLPLANSNHSIVQVFRFFAFEDISHYSLVRLRFSRSRCHRFPITRGKKGFLIYWINWIRPQIRWEQYKRFKLNSIRRDWRTGVCSRRMKQTVAKHQCAQRQAIQWASCSDRRYQQSTNNHCLSIYTIYYITFIYTAISIRQGRH